VFFAKVSARLNKFDLCSDNDTTKNDEKYKKNHDEKQDGSVEFYPNVDGNDIEEEVLEMGALWNDSEAVNSESMSSLSANFSGLFLHGCHRRFFVHWNHCYYLNL
jgi:hypothetical protein